MNMEKQYAFLKDIQIDLPQLCNIISDMTESRSPEKIQDLMSYLLEEVSYARHQWEECLKKQDWAYAAKILHREKLFISSLDVLADPDQMIRMQRNDSSLKTSDQKTFYAGLIFLFRNIEALIGQQNGRLPV